jgi:hypothetical protein
VAVGREAVETHAVDAAGQVPDRSRMGHGGSVTVPVIDYVLFSGITALSLLVAVTYPVWRRLKVTPRQSALKAEPRSLREVNDLTHHEN